MLHYLFSLLHKIRLTQDVLHCPAASLTPRALPSTRSCYPSVSVLHSHRWYWNINQLSIAYDHRPRLRSRLTLGGCTFPRKPWAFDVQVSRLHLVTHTGILSTVPSTAPLGTASASTLCSSTDRFRDPEASVACFSPGYLRRTITRPVSYYALFE